MTIDLIGKKFGRLTVMSREGTHRRPSGKGTAPLWRARCDCGTEGVFFGAALRNGNTTSCGCRQSEVTAKRNFRHGKTLTPVYRAWRAMIARCCDPKHGGYPDYGARGITICSRWLNSFEAFDADMGLRPEGFTLERNDNDIGYMPENCRWASRLEQGRNKRNNRFLTFGGQTIPVSQWAEQTGIPAGSITRRLDRLGWSVERTLTTSPRRWPKVTAPAPQCPAD